MNSLIRLVAIFGFFSVFIFLASITGKQVQALECLWLTQPRYAGGVDTLPSVGDSLAAKVAIVNDCGFDWDLGGGNTSLSMEFSVNGNYSFFEQSGTQGPGYLPADTISGYYIFWTNIKPGDICASSGSVAAQAKLTINTPPYSGLVISSNPEPVTFTGGIGAIIEGYVKKSDGSVAGGATVSINLADSDPNGGFYTARANDGYYTFSRLNCNLGHTISASWGSESGSVWIAGNDFNKICNGDIRRNDIPLSAPPPPKEPDLVPQTISGPSSLEVGQNGTFTSWIKNEGDAGTGDFNIVWDKDGGQAEGPWGHGGLSAAGQPGDQDPPEHDSVQLSFSSEGVHTVTFRVNPDGWYSDPTGNNSVSKTVNVTAPAPAEYPDLIIESLNLSTTTPTPGQDVDVTVVVKNNSGVNITSSFAVSFDWVNEPTQCNPPAYKKWTVSGLGPWATSSPLRTTFTAPQTSGQRTAWANADANCNVWEDAYEGNNKKPQTYTVQEDQPPPAGDLNLQVTTSCTNGRVHYWLTWNDLSGETSYEIGFRGTPKATNSANDTTYDSESEEQSIPADWANWTVTGIIPSGSVQDSATASARDCSGNGGGTGSLNVSFECDSTDNNRVEATASWSTKAGYTDYYIAQIRSPGGSWGNNRRTKSSSARWVLLPQNTNYEFQVKLESGGSVWAGPISGNTGSPPCDDGGGGGNLSVNFFCQSDFLKATLNWSSAGGGVTYYTYYKRLSMPWSVFASATTSTSADGPELAELIPGQTYFFKVEKSQPFGGSVLWAEAGPVSSQLNCGGGGNFSLSITEFDPSIVDFGQSTNTTLSLIHNNFNVGVTIWFTCQLFHSAGNETISTMDLGTYSHIIVGQTAGNASYPYCGAKFAQGTRAGSVGTVRLDTAFSTPSENYQMMVIGDYEGYSGTEQSNFEDFWVGAGGGADFSITVTADDPDIDLDAVPADHASYSVLVNFIGDWLGDISLTASSAADVNFSLSRQMLYCDPWPCRGSSSLTVYATALPGAIAGNYTMTVTGTSGSATPRVSNPAPLNLTAGAVSGAGNAWLKTEKGDVGAVDNFDPGSPPVGEENVEFLPIAGGSLNNTVATSGWVVDSYGDLKFKPQDYDDFWRKFGENAVDFDDITTIGTEDSYRFSSGQPVLTIPAGFNYSGTPTVVFVPGKDIVIEGDVTISPDTGIVFITSANINVAETAGSLDGVYVSGGSFNDIGGAICGSPVTADQLTVNGAVISFSDPCLNRTLPGVGNETQPAESFIFEGKYLDIFKGTLGLPSYEWQEVAP